MSQSPPPPVLSPDGRFFWDGQKWAPVPSEPRRKGRGGLILGCLVVVVVVVVIVAIIGSASNGSGPLPTLTGHTLHGTFTLLGENDAAAPSCSGTGGYTDIRSGAAVTVRDAAGKVIGTSSLGDGKVAGTSCVYHFDVSGLPDVDFYQVEISHRGSVNYSKATLAGDAWSVEVTLGH